jgi:hypothetical protein
MDRYLDQTFKWICPECGELLEDSNVGFLEVGIIKHHKDHIEERLIKESVKSKAERLGGTR